MPGHRMRLWPVAGREFKSGEAEGEESSGLLCFRQGCYHLGIFKLFKTLRSLLG